MDLEAFGVVGRAVQTKMMHLEAWVVSTLAHLCRMNHCPKRKVIREEVIHSEEMLLGTTLPHGAMVLLAVIPSGKQLESTRSSCIYPYVTS
jgi:hypothetical protein